MIDKNISKSSLLIVGVLLTGFFIAFYGVFINKPKSFDSHTVDDRIEIEFWTLQLDSFDSMLNGMFAEYEATHPDVHIKWVDIPSSEIEKRALTAMLSDDVPDVINLNPDFSAVLASRKALLNMNEALDTEVIKHYLPVAWQSATLENANATTPYTFGVPWYITSSLTLYNQDLLKKAGFAKPPTSHRELTLFAENVKTKANAYGLMPSIAYKGNFLKELKRVGIPLYDEDGNSLLGGNEPQTHLQRYISLFKRNLIPQETITEDHNGQVDRYSAGTLAMVMISPNFLNKIKENAPSVFTQTKVAPQFPTGSNFKDFSMMLLAVPRKSKHPKEAAEFAAFITNPENQLTFSKLVPILPSTSSSLQNAYFQTTHSANITEQARGYSARQLLDATDAYQIRPRQKEINEVVDYYVQKALLGQLNAKEALETAQKEINVILE